MDDPGDGGGSGRRLALGRESTAGAGLESALENQLRQARARRGGPKRSASPSRSKGSCRMGRPMPS